MHVRPHWSYSSINQYLACPLRYYFQRILGLPQPTVGSGLVFGSAVHAALAHYHLALKLNRTPQRNAIHNAFVDAWNQRNGIGITFKDGETRADLMTQGMALVELYLKEPPPERIVAVEQEIICPVHDSQGEYLETPLVAVADLIVETDSWSGSSRRRLGLMGSRRSRRRSSPPATSTPSRKSLVSRRRSNTRC
jgi:hypothetical protein